MNRKIKFRSWDGKEMTEMKTLFLSLKYKSGIEIMQFTGLKDKKGKDIYEGDIVSFLDEHFEVVYMEQYAQFMLSKGNDLQNITTQAEVIGNIHQNPDPLK